ncbi:MAG: DinB family protein [Chloroflexi bacterium]|nr:DinB family protein [Chloroflexota bacterium]
MTNRQTALREQLEKSRRELLQVLTGLSEAEWETAVYTEGTTWQVIDLLRHLTDAENGMITLMARIRDGSDGVPEDFDLDRWNASRIKKIQAKTTIELFTDMAQNRANLLAFMDSLGEADWAKKGRHGSGRIMSLQEICQIIADHEQMHTHDIRLALGE